jgi:hypothetical protein
VNGGGGVGGNVPPSRLPRPSSAACIGGGSSVSPTPQQPLSARPASALPTAPAGARSSGSGLPAPPQPQRPTAAFSRPSGNRGSATGDVVSNLLGYRSSRVPMGYRSTSPALNLPPSLTSHGPSYARPTAAFKVCVAVCVCVGGVD